MVLIPVIGSAVLVVVTLFGFFRGILGPTQHNVLNQTIDTSVRAWINSVSYTVMTAAKTTAPIAVSVIAAANSYAVGILLLGVSPCSLR
ncbi:hypothetical protein [Halorarum salinum]|uniref:Uncharacterized protein n=1 Tax=Halorarum salinum TaxID=2743089 RepID=A0A7D5QAG8_9EURY|nr:hypothetical protein [Halobaculum salinum]QLG60321.1 hypothetical protein HUG12_00535 [Halobaculum salinum]